MTHRRFAPTVNLTAQEGYSITVWKLNMKRSNGRVMFDCRTGIFRMTGLLCSFADFRLTERTEPVL